MKICPKCQKTYTDPNLNFCLDDGTVLTQSAGDVMPETVMMSQPPQTNPNQQAAPSFPGQQIAQPQQPGWNTAPQQSYSMQPPAKSSKAWIWVVLILGVVVVICGGGGLGALFYIGSQAEKNTNIANTNTNSKPTSSPTFGDKNPSTNSTTTSSSNRTNVTKVDLSEWVRPDSLYGDTSFTGGELMLASKQKRFYYVLAATSEYKTENADTSVTLRNVDDADSSLGYGLVFHSNTTPLQQGYAFLIDTKKKKYHVVNHVPSDEKNVVSWTKSDAIRDGSQENILEVRDISKDKIELYINGTMVTSIKNVYGYPGGVVGLYSGDKVKIAFKDLQIKR